MARTMSIVIAGAVVLVMAACVLSVRRAGLFFETGTPPAGQAESDSAAPRA